MLLGGPLCPANIGGWGRPEHTNKEMEEGREGGRDGGREGEEAKGTHHVSSQYTKRGSPHNYVGAKREREGR